jgi:hypothetical protein
LFTFVFPTILRKPIAELPTYVGLATLLLAMIGVLLILQEGGSCGPAAST